MLPLLKPALLVEMKALDPTAGPPAPWLASAKVTEGLHSDEVRMRPEPAALPLICPGRVHRWGGGGSGPSTGPLAPAHTARARPLAQVRKRGSYAVQAMLRWLEVARLTRSAAQG